MNKIVGTIITCLMILSFSTFICGDVFAAGGTGNVSQMGKQMYIWHFEEGSGTETKDATAGLVGTLVGDIKWVEGKTGNTALEFSGEVGAPQYVEVEHSDEVNIDEQITMAAWVYPDPLPTGGQENKFTIIFKAAYYLQIEPGDGSASPIAYYFYETAPEGYHLSDGTIEAGQWTHVALVWDGSQASFYINGEQDSNVVEQTGVGRTNDTAVQFGGENADCCPRFFQGRLDEVVIANYALSEGEIGALMSMVAVQPQSKLPITWGEVKGQ
jgi:hypothetical protein